MWFVFYRLVVCLVLCRPGSDLLSRVLRRSTIGAGEFHGRVRDGIGCISPRHDHQAGEGQEPLMSRKSGNRFCDQDMSRNS